MRMPIELVILSRIDIANERTNDFLYGSIPWNHAKCGRETMAK